MYASVYCNSWQIKFVRVPSKDYKLHCEFAILDYFLLEYLVIEKKDDFEKKSYLLKTTLSRLLNYLELKTISRLLEL